VTPYIDGWGWGPLSTNSNTVNIPPGAPTPGYISPRGASNLEIAWFAPAAGTWTDFQVEVSTNGTSGWTVVNAHTTNWYVEVPTSVPLWARVRANAPGGQTYSAVFGPGTPVSDVTPPGDVSWQSFKPESSYGRMVMRAACPGDADLNFAQIERNVGGAGWEALWASGVTPGQALALDIGTFSAGQTVQCRVYLRDATGNARYSSVVAHTLVASPTYVSPDSANYWIANPGVFNQDGSHRPHQGYFSDATKWTRGFWYYGTKIRDACAGRSVWAINIFLARVTGGTSGTQQIYLATHPYTTDPGNAASGTPTLYDQIADGALSIGASGWAGLSSTMVANLAAADSTGRWGVGTGDVNKPYMIFASLADNSFSGLLEVHHLG
jgi:hypothetical protein